MSSPVPIPPVETTPVDPWADPAIVLLADALVVVPFVGLLAVIYLWRIYLEDTDKPRSWVLFRLAGGATIAEVVAVVIAVLVVRRLNGVVFGWEGTLVLGLAIIILEAIPLMFAYSAWSLRKFSHDKPVEDGK